MADGTKIEWTDATWNVINGCLLASPGCTNCYAMRLAATRLKHHPSRAGLATIVNGNPVWTGETRFNEPVLEDPLRWRRPRRIFVCAHGDLFHDSVPDEWIDKVFAVMALAPRHQFQVLTKRAARMRDYLANPELQYRVRKLQPPLAMPRGLEWGASPVLPNVWLGVSVEDQRRADERIPHLLATPAAVRWLSCEPLLGPVNLARLTPPGCTWLNGLTGAMHAGPAIWSEFDRGVDWVVAGGESGPGARPMHPNWARWLRNQCQGAQVPFLFKQWGEHRPLEDEDDWWNFGDPDKDHPNVWHSRQLDCNFARCGKKRAGRLLDGQLHDGFPAQ